MIFKNIKIIILSQRNLSKFKILKINNKIKIRMTIKMIII